MKKKQSINEKQTINTDLPEWPEVEWPEIDLQQLEIDWPEVEWPEEEINWS